MNKINFETIMEGVQLNHTRRILALVALIMAVSASSGMAARNKHRPPPATIEEASPEEIVDGMGHKFVRGVANSTTGIAEIPKQIYDTSVDEGPVMGVTVGVFKGFGMMVARTASGAWDVATFLVPIPWFYESLVSPDYVFRKN